MARATRILAATGLCGLALAGAPALGPPTPQPAASRAVIVQTSGRPAEVAAAVRRAGGTVTRPLPIVHGFAARIPARAVAAVERLPGVRAVTPDVALRPAETQETTGAKIRTVNSVYRRETNADRLSEEGVDGAGVTVALVDTGVSPVPDVRDRLVRVVDPVTGTGEVDCVNLSGEPTCEDSYGHGTFLAGLIAGDGRSSAGSLAGMAPGARIVSVKIAGRDGSADVSKVLAAIQWVVSFRERYGIRVLNLSLGTDSPISYRIDPLNFAVEEAWRHGLVVVVAASNRGPRPGTISKPGDDPFVVTVGAVDDRETPAIDDDRLPRFSGRGPTATDGLAKPDVVAPGAKLISLRSPGSYVESAAPPGVLHGTPYRRASGTSMAAAVVSGATALILDRNEAWSPDRVKFALAATARKVAARDVFGVGSGLVDAYAAARLTAPGLANTDVETLSDGTGDLDGSRGSVQVTGNQCGLVEPLLDPNCAVVHGQETAQGATFDQQEYTGTDWTGSSWYESQWAGSSWYGSSWYEERWHGEEWRGSSWYGNEDLTFYGADLDGSSWYGGWE